MVISDRLAWGHIPKTGGDITHAYFSQFQTQLKLEIDNLGLPNKHDYFAMRNIDDSRILLLNIRRLPSLILSVVHHKINYDGANIIDFKKDILEKTNPDNSNIDYSTYADTTLLAMTSFGDRKLKISKWLRCENILEDFTDFIVDWVDYSRQQIKEMLEPIHVKDFNSYDHEISKYWTSDEIKIIYKNNPLWASVEKEVYGDLLYESYPLGIGMTYPIAGR